MSEEQAFLDHLSADPVDDVTRQVYADWLDERGDATQAAYLRAETELAALIDNELPHDDLEREVREQAKTLPAEWLAAAGRPWDVWLLGYPPTHKIAVIKVVRELIWCGLAEAKTLVESLPALVVTRAPRAIAESARTKLQDVTGFPDPVGTPHAPTRAALRPWSPASDGLVLRPASYYQILIRGARPRRKSAAIRALVQLFFWTPFIARARLEANVPFAYGHYRSEAEAQAVAERLADSVFAEVRRFDPPPVPCPAPPNVLPAGAAGPFVVRLRSYAPGKKIAVIKAIRELTGVGLAEAKAWAERPFPIALYQSADAETARRAANLFTEHGAVEVIQSS